MTGLTISQLPPIYVTNPNALLVIVVSGTTYQIPFSALTLNFAINNVVGNGHLPVFSGNNTYVTSVIHESLDVPYSQRSVHIGHYDPYYDPLNPDKLGVYAGETDSFNLVVGRGSIDNYLQINCRNFNSGATASSDVVATADNGNEEEFYIDMGINSSTYSATTLVGSLNDGYLYSTGNDLYIGNATPGKKLVLFNGGFDTEAYSKFYIHEDSSITINTPNVDPNNPAAIRLVNVNGSTAMIHADGDIDDFSEINSINTNAGEFASADIVATNDLGNTDPDQGFVNMGINSTTYVLTDNIGGPNDAYMYGTGTHMHIGNASESPFSDVYIFTNGRGDEATRIAVMADGTVGFHTMTPQYPVDISGTTRVQNGDFIITSGQTNLGVVIQATNNADAILSGLTVGDVYRTGDFLKIVH